MRTICLPVLLLLIAALPARADDLVPFPAQPAGVPFPTREWPEFIGQPEHQTIQAIAAKAFDGKRPLALAKSKALLVVSGGRIIAEHYAPGITRTTRLQSWSMAKSLLHAGLGIAMADGLIREQDQGRVPEWSAAGDPRWPITLRQLAQMTDGLDFAEDYADPKASVMQMLFGAGRGDVAHAAAASRFKHQRGTNWNYSGGSANILSRVLRDKLGGREAYRNFLQARLFRPLGMTSAVPEFDAAGTWIASSYLHATARDYARFGLLYLRGGVWEGKQIVPRNWVDVARTPTLASKGEYGALFWLNAANPDTGVPAISPALPQDMFFARGFGGQLIAAIPSRDAVIVMLNVSYADDASPIVQLMEEIVQALPQ